MRTRKLYHDSDHMQWQEVSDFNPSRNQDGSIIYKDGEKYSAQEHFVTTKTKFLCGAGGFGSGKTHGLIRRACAMSIDSPWFGDLSGNVGLMGRLKMLDFLKTTLMDFMRIIPKAWIRKHWVRDEIIELVNESVIHYTHLDSIEHLQSYNFGWCAIDQMEQIDWNVFKAVGYERCRLKSLTRYKDGVLVQPKFSVDDKGNVTCVSTDPVELSAWLKFQSVFGVCNPRRGWIYDKFVRNQMYKDSPIPQLNKLYNPLFEMISFTTYDNIANLPDGYIEQQKHDKSEREFKRSILNVWDSFEGQIYEDFTDDLINDKNEISKPYWRHYIGIDHGGSGTPDERHATNITAVIFVAEERRQGLLPIIHIIDELYLPSSTIEETVTEIHNKLRSINIQHKVNYPDIMETEQFQDRDYLKLEGARCDPNMMKHMDDSTESFMTAYIRHARMKNLMLPLAPGGSGILERMHKINWLCRKKLIRVNPKCVHFINSMRSYEFGDNEKPKTQQDDHEINAFEYCVTAIPLWIEAFKEKKEKPLAQKWLDEKVMQNKVDPILGKYILAE